jgi:hypothetical protein
MVNLHNEEKFEVLFIFFSFEKNENFGVDSMKQSFSSG